MKVEAPVNPNYAATVIVVKSLVKLANSDNLQGIPMFGMQAITDMGTKVGDIGILIPAEAQLSAEFCHENDMFTHSELNKDKTKRGYIEANGRIRAIRLRGNRSDALFMPVSSLLYTVPTDHALGLNEGDVFDKIGDHLICQKYERPQKGRARFPTAPRAKPRVDEKLFPQQFDILHFLRVNRNLDPNAFCYVTQKLHGCNIRIGCVPVSLKLSWFERLLVRLGVRIADYEYDNIYGSHRVIKDANNPNQRHFYETDLWTDEGKKLDGVIPEGYILYGELIGYVPGTATPVQEGFTYNLSPGNCQLYVYRVAFVNGEGTVCDLSWPAVKEFCASIGVEHVPELWSGYINQLEESRELPYFLNTKFKESEYADIGDDGNMHFENAVPLSDDSICDEGIVIRIEGMQPQLYKVKSDEFVRHETKMIDQEVVDIEAQEEVFDYIG